MYLVTKADIKLTRKRGLVFLCLVCALFFYRFSIAMAEDMPTDATSQETEIINKDAAAKNSAGGNTTLQKGSEVRTVTLELLPEEAPLISWRSLADAAGASINWDNGQQAVCFSVGNLFLVAQPGRNYIYAVNKKEGHCELSRFEWPQPPILEKDRCYVSASFLPFMGMYGVWDEDCRLLDIVLDEELYSSPTPQISSNEAWTLIEAHWEADTPRPPQLLGSFTTVFNPAEKNRTNNLQQCIAAIDGTVIKAGGSFSFNQTVGPRTPENNYLKAIIFMNGEKVEDFGGGVCQVSTTLFNAAKKAGMTITERHPHTLPVTYVKENEDAAVYYGVKDLRFYNGTEQDAIICCLIKGNQLTIELRQYFADRKA